jgi:hypothetical protein
MHKEQTNILLYIYRYKITFYFSLLEKFRSRIRKNQEKGKKNVIALRMTNTNDTVNLVILLNTHMKDYNE